MFSSIERLYSGRLCRFAPVFSIAVSGLFDVGQKPGAKRAPSNHILPNSATLSWHGTKLCFLHRPIPGNMNCHKLGFPAVSHGFDGKQHAAWLPRDRGNLKSLSLAGSLKLSLEAAPYFDVST